jgi:hypothetical protein
MLGVSSEDLEAIEAAREEFVGGFRRSKKGNLWRYYDDAEGKALTLCVFKRWDALYAWSISDPEGPRYSPSGYEFEESALGELFRAVTGY